MDDRLPVDVQVLDRVLDREDVAGAGRVDRVDQRRHRGRLPGTGRAGEQDQAALELDELAHRVGHADLVKRRDLTLDEPQRDRGQAALEEGVATEAVRAPREREVDVAVAPQLLELLRAEQVAEELGHLRVVDDRQVVRRTDGPVEAHRRRCADRECEVGAVGADHSVQGRGECCVNFHGEIVSGAEWPLNHPEAGSNGSSGG